MGKFITKALTFCIIISLGLLIFKPSLAFTNASSVDSLFIKEAVKLGENKFIVELNDLSLAERVDFDYQFPFFATYQKTSIQRSKASSLED